MNDELPMGAQVIVPPGDNEHIMQAAIAAAQMHANRRRDTRYYEQAVATPPSWLHAGVPEAPPTEPPDWRHDAERQYYYNAHKYGGLRHKETPNSAARKQNHVGTRCPLWVVSGLFPQY